MKVKLLKKVRARHTMTYNPNNMVYPYKLVVRYNWKGDAVSKVYKDKNDMFEAYRLSMINICKDVYYQFKKVKNIKPIELINHCK